MKIYRHHSGKYHIRYSQNFIKSTNLAKKIVELAEINSEDTVIEIGAGKGALTRFIIPKSRNVIAIEKDKELCNSLKANFNKYNNIMIINDDFLKYVLPNQDYKIIGNIPFSITSEIFRKVLNAPNPPKSITLIVQKEAAMRLIQTNLFSLKYFPWVKTKILMKLNKTDFYPIPNVDIIVIKIIKREDPLIKYEYREEYLKFIDYCFKRWKKDMYGVLDKLFTYKQLRLISEKNHINLKKKPTEISQDEWLIIFRVFTNLVAGHKKFKNF